VPSGNLLQNPDAEAGSCSNSSGTQVPIPGWTTTGNFTVLCYSAGVTLTPSVSSSIGGGANYFMGGTDPTTNARQDVDVSAGASDIDAGLVTASLSGDLGGFENQDDYMTVYANFLNASGAPAAPGVALQIGPVKAADRANQTGLVNRFASVTVPPGTRTIEVAMVAVRVAGSDNDASADNLSLSLYAQKFSSVSVNPNTTKAQVSGHCSGCVGPVTIDYGPTASYGHTTTTTLSSSGDFSGTITGLTAGTTYHYRLSAGNPAGGNYVKGDATFTTPTVQVAPVITTSGGQLFRCLSTHTCIGSISLTSAGALIAAARQTVLGKASFKVAAHKRKVVSIRFSKAAAKALRHHGLKATETVTEKLPGGQQAVTVLKVAIPRQT
jgi:hypothetical protein